MTSNINSVAVLGAGTMGSGIAALAAEKNCKVLLLDVSEEAAAEGRDSLLLGRTPALSDVSKKNNIEVGSFSKDFDKIKDFDWICEVVVENIEIKQDIFKKIEEHKGSNAIVSSNTSGIPLREITKYSSIDLLKSVCITHFFNPVRVMKLCELIPGEKTSKDVIETLKYFLENVFDKGVVHGKDTVNFIGNRIGCFLLLKGLHTSSDLRKDGITVEQVDALISKPMGLPPTGLYGLIDLIGLDVMHAVGLNLSKNLPNNDIGRGFVNLPKVELEMFNNGQLGRKTGGGFYRIKKLDNGEKLKEVFDLEEKTWRAEKKFDFDKDISVIFEDSIEGRLSWSIMGYTLWYAATLIPEISDDILNIDRAMRWGFAWSKGPFELLDLAGNLEFINKCKEENLPITGMLKVLLDSGEKTFYKDEKKKYLSLDGSYYYVS